MALILGQEYPELYAAVGVHSGVPPGVATDLLSALRTMSTGPVDAEVPKTTRRRKSRTVPTIVFHGDADKTVHPSNAAAIHHMTHPRRRRAVGAMLLTTDRSTKTRMRARKGMRAVTRTHHSTDGIPDAELWIVHGGGHAWAGGSPAETYTDSGGPDASREMVRFFLQQRLDGADTHPEFVNASPEHSTHKIGVLRAALSTTCKSTQHFVLAAQYFVRGTKGFVDIRSAAYSNGVLRHEGKAAMGATGPCRRLNWAPAAGEWVHFIITAGSLALPDLGEGHLSEPLFQPMNGRFPEARWSATGRVRRGTLRSAPVRGPQTSPAVARYLI